MLYQYIKNGRTSQAIIKEFLKIRRKFFARIILLYDWQFSEICE